MERGGCCAKAVHGVRITIGVCGICEQREPRDGTGLVALIKAAPKVAAALVRTEDPALAEKRLAICKGCEHWDGNRCRKCGCFTALKVRLKSESCPVGKWPAVD
jgi:hypothetical protein